MINSLIIFSIFLFCLKFPSPMYAFQIEDLHYNSPTLWAHVYFLKYLRPLLFLYLR